MALISLASPMSSGLTMLLLNVLPIVPRPFDSEAQGFCPRPPFYVPYLSPSSHGFAGKKNSGWRLACLNQVLICAASSVDLRRGAVAMIILIKACVIWKCAQTSNNKASAKAGANHRIH